MGHKNHSNFARYDCGRLKILKYFLNKNRGALNSELPVRLKLYHGVFHENFQRFHLEQGGGGWGYNQKENVTFPLKYVSMDFPSL